MNNVREEAIKRIETLVNTFKLNPNILKYFKDGQVYYSYTIFMGASASIDKISYDKEYEKAVQDFETEHKGYLVYHAIESLTEQGKMLTLIYVGSDEEEWGSERLADDSIMAYVVNFTHPEYSEFGYVSVGRHGESGALARTDIKELPHM